jgi:hypothetical protein
MPVSIDDADILTDFRRDHFELLLGQTANVDLNMECLVGTEFSDDSARQHVQIVKTLENSSDGAWVSVC